MEAYYKRIYWRAHRLMVEAHEGQMYGNEPYKNHPISVAKMATSLEEATVAILHDTIEDTWVTPEDLMKAQIPAHIIEAVIAITRQEGETYKEFVVRCSKNKLGARVKYWDATRNLGRNHELPKERRGLAKRYRKVVQFLGPIVFGELKGYGD